MTVPPPATSTSPASITAAPTIPVRIDTAACAVARALFTRARFDEPTVAARLGGNTMFGYGRLVDGRTTLAGPVADPQAALIRLLVDAEPMPAAEARRWLGDEEVAALETLGLLVPVDGTVRAPVLLTPVAGLWMASELPTWRGRPVAGQVPADAVFPAMTELTRDFVAALPDMPGARVAELCAGTGIGALRAMARGARAAWAGDIGARSVEFARFNAALNGFDDVTCVVSEGWDGFGVETCDFVCAHPPYVPSLVHEFDYRDGGADGEHVTRRVVEGLPRHLRPGGRLAMTCALTDRDGEPLEARLRKWLGDAEREFDVVVLVRDEWDRMRAWRSATGGGDGHRDLERWMHQFDALGIESFALAAIELRRTARGREPRTTRRVGSEVVDAAAVEWSHAWTLGLDRAPTPLERLAGVRPRAIAGIEVDMRARTDAMGDCVPFAAVVRTQYPVTAAVQVPLAAVPLLALCNGERDVPTLHATLATHPLGEKRATVAQIAELVELLASIGVVDLGRPPVPAPPTPPQYVRGATSSMPMQSSKQ